MVGYLKLGAILSSSSCLFPLWLLFLLFFFFLGTTVSDKRLFLFQQVNGFYIKRKVKVPEMVGAQGFHVDLRECGTMEIRTLIPPRVVLYSESQTLKSLNYHHLKLTRDNKVRESVWETLKTVKSNTKFECNSSRLDFLLFLVRQMPTQKWKVFISGTILNVFYTKKKY